MIRPYSVGAAGVALALASACVFNTKTVRQQRTASYAGTDWTTFRVVVDRLHSPLTIDGRAATSVDVHATVRAWVAGSAPESVLDDVALVFDAAGGILELSTRSDGPYGESIGLRDLAVELPSTAAVDLDVGAADLRVRGVEGRIAAVASAGALDVITTGLVSLETGAGDIFADAAGGDITNISGKIDAVLAGEASLANSSGPIVATVGGPATVVSDDGDIDLLWSATDATLEVRTNGGNVTAIVPEGAGYRVTITSTGGEIDVDASIADGDVLVEKDRALYDDTIAGGGGGMISITAGTGSVTLRAQVF